MGGKLRMRSDFPSQYSFIGSQLSCHSDTLDEMNPQVPGYPTGAPPAWGAGAPAGATVVAPPAYAPPPLPPSPPPASHSSLFAAAGIARVTSPGWIAVWTMFTAALLLAATAVALSIANLNSNTATTTTVTAHRRRRQTFSPGPDRHSQKRGLRRQL